MKEGDVEILCELSRPIPLDMLAALLDGAGERLARIGYEAYIRPPGTIVARKRWPVNDLPVVNWWDQPIAVQNLDDQHAAWKDSEGYWWPAWYLPRDEETE